MLSQDWATHWASLMYWLIEIFYWRASSPLFFWQKIFAQFVSELVASKSDEQSIRNSAANWFDFIGWEQILFNRKSFQPNLNGQFEIRRSIRWTFIKVELRKIKGPLLRTKVSKTIERSLLKKKFQLRFALISEPFETARSSRLEN